MRKASPGLPVGGSSTTGVAAPRDHSRQRPAASHVTARGLRALRDRDGGDRAEKTCELCK